MSDDAVRLPRDNLFRALSPGPELVRDSEDEDLPTLHGHFAVFDEWTEINSHYEGHFLERIVPGAFKKTFREQRSDIRALFQHGMDPQIGDKPLGPIESLEEDEVGARYSVPMLDTDYNRELIPGLEAGLYGASFRFRVLREETDNEPERSEHNPDAIQERTIREAQVFEFGPVTFPAYSKATAGVRSMRPVDLHIGLEERAAAEVLPGGLLVPATSSTPTTYTFTAGSTTEALREALTDENSDAEPRAHLAQATRGRQIRRLGRKGRSWKLP